MLRGAGKVTSVTDLAVPMQTRRQLVDTEAARLASLGATLARVLQPPGQDHYAVAKQDPEGNEFDIN